MCVCQKQGINTKTESSRASTAFFRINCSAVLKPNADDCAGEESARVPIMFGRHFTRASTQNRTLLGTTSRWELKECKVAQQNCRHSQEHATTPLASEWLRGFRQGASSAPASAAAKQSACWD